MNQEFERWLAVTTFLPGYTPINGVATNLMEMSFKAGAETERARLINKLQELYRMGEQKDDSRMANQAEALIKALRDLSI